MTLHDRVAAASLGRRARAEEEFVFRPATKYQAKARLALDGPSGSGKSYTALKIASGLGRNIGVIDTEHGSAAKYSKLFPFHHLPFTKPYDPRRLVRALTAAVAQGMDVAVIDSLSHFWQGTGGMLDQVDGAARRSYGGNQFAGWKEAGPMERDLIEAMLALPCHLVVTMRTKTEWVIEESGGKKVPRKIGTKPVQREGIEYEFDLMGELDLSNTLTISKSRCPELSGGVYPQPGLEIAQQILEWLEDGEDARTAADLRDEAAKPDVTKETLRDLYKEAALLGLKDAVVLDGDGRAVKLTDYITVRSTQVSDTAEAEEPATAA